LKSRSQKSNWLYARWQILQHLEQSKLDNSYNVTTVEMLRYISMNLPLFVPFLAPLPNWICLSPQHNKYIKKVLHTTEWNSFISSMVPGTNDSTASQNWQLFCQNIWKGFNPNTVSGAKREFLSEVKNHMSLKGIVSWDFDSIFMILSYSFDVKLLPLDILFFPILMFSY
jgi:hypothetical protein